MVKRCKGMVKKCMQMPRWCEKRFSGRYVVSGSLLMTFKRNLKGIAAQLRGGTDAFRAQLALPKFFTIFG